MSDSAARWQRVRALFDRAVDLPSPQREQLLDAECGDDAGLRAEVEQLLRADSQHSRIDRGIAGRVDALLRAGEADRQLGRMFGPYRIERLLGQGGMGRVYLAHRDGDDFQQTVALKLVGGPGSFDADLAQLRFVEERRILARLQHPHIARLLDGGLGDDGQPWFAMEYVDGAPLDAWCDTRRLDVNARLELFAKICDAVDYAHRQLIVHRDLKPGNLLVDAHGEPKVLDFGIAKLLDDGAPSAPAATLLMTPDYAAPEQLRGGAIGTATDVYALGAVLFGLLTGRPPFKDPLAPRDPPSAARSLTGGDGTPLVARARACATTPRVLRRQLRGDLDRVLRTALDPDPSRRYRSAARLAEDLRAIAGDAPISLRSDRGYRLGKFLHRHRWSATAAAGALLGLLATTGWALWQTRQAAAQARIATQESRTANSVKNFIAGLLHSASPEVSLGRELTVKQVLDNSRQSLPLQLEAEPAVAVELLTVMARSYLSLEDHANARALLDRAAALAPKVDAERRAALHTARIELALERSDMAAMRAAAAQLRPLLPQLHDPGLRVDALLALGNFDNHEYRATAQQALQPLEEARKALPQWDVRRIKAASILAGWYLGRPEPAAQRKALALLEETLADAQRYLPARHPDVIYLRTQLAYGYRSQRDYARAAAQLRRVLDDTIAVHGADSAKVAFVESQLGNIEKSRGNYTGVAAHAERALRLYQRHPVTDPMDVSAVKMLLAEAAEVRGDYAAAQRWYEGAHQDFTSGAAAHARSMPYLQINIARMLARQGKRADAATLYATTLQGAPPGSLAQALIWSGQGELAREAGDPKAALDLHQRALALLKPKRDTRPSYYVGVLLQLARDQQALGQAQAAETSLAEAVRMLDAEFPLARPELADAYLLLGQLRASRAAHDAEARRLLARAVEVRRQVYGAEDARTGEAAAMLAKLTRE